MSIIATGTFTANGAPYPIILDPDIGGSFASLATETAIGALPSASLTLLMERVSRSTGIKYVLSSLTPGNGFANGTWTAISAPVSTSWTSVAAATTGNITLSGAQTIDGASLLSGSGRVLVWKQTTTSQNGIYIYNSAGAWTRATDADAAAEFSIGKSVAVVNGATYAGGIFICSQAPATLGTDPISFVQNAAGGSTFNASSPPPIGNVTPNQVYSTDLVTTNGLISSGPVQFTNGTPPVNGLAIDFNVADVDTTVTNLALASSRIRVFGTTTAVRKQILPLTGNAPHARWLIGNFTTGGFDIQVGGSTGAAINIQNGTWKIVWTDGTDFFEGPQPSAIAGAGGASEWASGKRGRVSIYAAESDVVADNNIPILSSFLTVDTSNATPVSFTLPVPANSTTSYDVVIVARSMSNNGDYWRGSFSFEVTRQSGNASLNPSSPAVVTSRSSGALSACTAAITVSTSNCLISVTGVAATNIRWSVVPQGQRVLT